MILLLCGCKNEAADTALTEISVSDTEETEVEAEQTIKQEETEEPKIIYVYVCGEVRNPGVYKLEQGERITHAILVAGGMTDRAADSYLNQAELLTDGQKIYVPDKEEAESLQAEGLAGTETASDGKININTADKSALTSLSGIGDARAEAIITYREANGGFKNIEEIKNIDGIKDGIFEKIKDQIKVE